TTLFRSAQIALATTEPTLARNYPNFSQREMTSVRSSGTASTVLGLKRQAVRINGANGNRATWTGGPRGRNRRVCHAAASAKAGARVSRACPEQSRTERRQN